MIDDDGEADELVEYALVSSKFTFHSAAGDGKDL